MTDIDLIRELDRLFLIAIDTETVADWMAYFRLKAIADERFGLTAQAA